MRHRRVSSGHMDYREYAPRPSLADYVQCLWTLDGRPEGDPGGVDPVLPDGRSELVLHFGDPFERVSAEGLATTQPALLFAGQLEGRLLLRPTGRVSVLGVRFRPNGAAALLDMPQHALVGLTLGVADLQPALARSLDEVRDAVVCAADAVALVQARLERWGLRDRLDPRVRYAVEVIGRHRGRVSIDALAHDACLTRRHLERQFRDQVGISPKRLARIARFQHALCLMDRPDARRQGAHTAATCGYADQPHFVRDWGLFAAAGQAWSPGVEIDEARLARLLDAHVYRDAAGELGTAAMELANAYLATGSPATNGSAHAVSPKSEPAEAGLCST